MTVKIIQIMCAPEDCKYQGSFLGLGDDGVVYVANGSGEWECYMPLKFKVSALSDREQESKLMEELTTRSYRILEGIGIRTIQQLINSNLTYVDVKQIPSCGLKSTEEIIDVMYKLKNN